MATLYEQVKKEKMDFWQELPTEIPLESLELKETEYDYPNLPASLPNLSSEATKAQLKEYWEAVLKARTEDLKWLRENYNTELENNPALPETSEQEDQLNDQNDMLAEVKSLEDALKEVLNWNYEMLEGVMNDPNNPYSRVDDQQQIISRL
jgi:hypothetical protein